MLSQRRGGLCIFIAATLCTCSTPLLADQLILRCDSPKGALSFSVLLDPAKRTVLNKGLGAKLRRSNSPKPLLQRATRTQQSTKTSSLIELRASSS